MAIDTKPNFSCRKFEQCNDDIMNLSGCTQIFGFFDMESGSTFTICDNVGAGKILTSDAGGVATWQDPAAQGVTGVTAGNGMDFTEITSSGDVTLGTPSTITSGTTNAVGATTHCHSFNSSTFVTGTQGILVDGNNRFYLDDTYITDATLPSLYSYSGITANQSIGALPSGQTLGMVYITNTGSTTGYYNLGTTPTGNDITPFQPIEVDAGEDASITVNMRLSQTENTTIYVNSDNWTNAGINLQWANITYQNASTTINPGDLPVATPTTIGAISVGDGLSVDGNGHLCATGGTGADAVTGATNLGSGLGQIYAAEINDQLQFKTLSGGSNITISTNANYVNIESTGGVGNAANGLCVCGDNITLGGTLTGSTVICSTGTNCFNIEGTDGSGDGIWFKDGESSYIGKSSGSYTCYSYADFLPECAQIASSDDNNSKFACIALRAQNTALGCGSICMNYTGQFTISDSNQVGAKYGGDYSANFTDHSLVTKKYVSGLTSGGSGGFLGLVTKASAEPSDLQDNQWVKPEPMSTDCFNYTFDNFSDSGGTAISVNLSLCDSFLRYCCTGATGGYWLNESYAKPLSSGYTWMGDSNCKACEIQIIDEWVGSESQLQYAGQKYAYPTQTVFQIDVGCCITIPNKIFCADVELCTVGDTTLFTIPAGKTAMLNSVKLIMSQDANPDSFTVSMGNNCCTTPSLSFNNMVNNFQIDDVLTREVYELVGSESSGACCDGSCLIDEVRIRVQSGSTGTLCANVLLEGYVF
jgi:hypothetical protein